MESPSAPNLSTPIPIKGDEGTVATPSGLSSEEAARILAEQGPNEIVIKKQNLIFQYLTYFKNPLVIILLIAGFVSGLSGQGVQAGIIFFLVFVSVTLDFYQENKSNQAAQRLKDKVTNTASVLRDGKPQDIKISSIVPGDVVLLSAGDIVPADGRVIVANDFFVDQSSLTGEAFPVEKSHVQKPKEGEPDDNAVSMGSSVVSGSATIEIVRTGASTLYGQIAKKLMGKETDTEYTKGIRQFGYLITELTIFLVLFVFVVNAAFNRDLLQSLLFALALAVGLTPELLPMIITVVLSRGAIKMAGKDVIVKKLSSIQDLGSMDILCTDKTGTLTENRIELILHVDPEGNDDDSVLLDAYLNSVFETGIKSPLDAALLEYRKIETAPFTKVDEIPFDFVRKKLSVVVAKDNQRTLITKGAPEEIFKSCSKCRLKSGMVDMVSALAPAEESFREMSEKGFRVLGIAEKALDGGRSVYGPADENGMTFIGFLAFLDPPKESAAEAISLMRSSGIDLKVLTGDNELVTRHVCESIGVEVKGIVLGSDISNVTDMALAVIVERANLFCRMNPVQKERIIRALRANKHVVGYLGDGINDSPPLKAADVGISVDTAVDVAKESADIILLKKDLKVLEDGVLEGRQTHGNTMKYIMMGTSSNFGNMFSVAAASVFLTFLPMLPIQILLGNLMYDLSELTIPTDNVDRSYIEKPRRLSVKFIRNYTIVFGLISSAFDLITFAILLFVFNASPQQFQSSWFIEGLATQVLIIFVIRTRITPFYKSKPSRLLTLSSLIIVVLGFLIPYTPIGALFQLVAPPLEFYLALVGIIAAYLALVEVVKFFFYRYYVKRGF
ncbi:MAG TPA: magnesium-translocating P-type ATPase [Methanomassiliicoccales archaeon]|jgi:Mg2+-importing ATPase